MELVRDLSAVVNAFNHAHPEVDTAEVMACLGTTAGACISSAPTESERTRARDSVVSSLDKAIEDFLFARENRQ
jgi:hypothetical protein